MGNAGFVPDPSGFDWIRHGAYFALSFNTFKQASGQGMRIKTLPRETSPTHLHQMCAHDNHQDQKLRIAPILGQI
jgi:hypothetical protein